MKPILVSFLSLFLLTQCRESGTENYATELLIGSWKHADEQSTISFDPNGTYTVQFGSDMTISSSYRLNSSAGEHKLFVQSADVTYECAYQLLGDDRLKLTRINPPKRSDKDNMVGIYHRLH